MLKYLAGAAAVGFLHRPAKKQEAKPKPRSAVCLLFPNDQTNVRGIVAFTQDKQGEPTRIAATVRGLQPNSKHGIHIHQFGDLTEGCKTAGPHFNPFNKSHGGPDSPERHVGDLGNLQSDASGTAFLTLTDKQVSLFGQNSVVGRSVVVHKGQDDLGRGSDQESKKTGNSGARVACGIIGLSDKFKGVAQKQL